MTNGFLLDTNVVSETRKTRPLAALIRFLEGTDPHRLFLSVLTLGELRRGVEDKRRHDQAVADALAHWIDGLEQAFGDRIISVDTAVARLWGELSAGRSRPVIDTLLAATAMVNRLTIVTRNVGGYDAMGAALLDPWNLWQA